MSFDYFARLPRQPQIMPIPMNPHLAHTKLARKDVSKYALTLNGGRKGKMLHFQSEVSSLKHV